MTRYLLYYAGMAADKVTEQIGAAVSDDGAHFERLAAEPLLPVDPRRTWKARRTCNPTVLIEGDRFVMFYQGVSDGLEHTTIARATSHDGVDWECDDEPCLTGADMRRLDPGQRADERVSLIEPSVLHEDGGYRMWFVYQHGTQPGNAIYYAQSADGVRWEVDDRKVLTGSTFGRFLIHYPQVRRIGAGYELYCMLRSETTFMDGIFRMTSPDGREWRELKQVVPRYHNGIYLEPRRVLDARLAGGGGLRRVGHKLESLNVRAAARLAKGSCVLGWGHPHVLTVNGAEVMYYHASNQGPRGRWHSIGRFDMVDGAPTEHREVLSPAGDGWEGYFVADPFVVAAP